MKLRDVLNGVEPVNQAGDVEIAGLTALPQSVRPGVLFAKLLAPWLPPRGLCARAVAGGASALMLQAGDTEGNGLPCLVRVADVNRAYAMAAANFHGHAHRSLRLYGVTGTKGKTTTVHLLEAALRAAGRHTGMIGSVVCRTPAGERRSNNTTPEPAELHALFREMLDQGATDVVLEVSSIGIAEQRLYGLRFSGVLFTNLGADHYEYHGGRDAYLACKRRLFADASMHRAPSIPCVLNADDPAGREFAASAAGRAITYGIHNGDVRPDDYELSAAGTRVRVSGQTIATPLLGEHNVYNILAAFAAARDILGSAEAAARGLSQARPVPGRLERVPGDHGVTVFVDAAHTPESVAAALEALAKTHAGRRLVAVVGCSGGSDRGKRPLMARAALGASDLCVATSDNPRWDDPVLILAEMVAGIESDARLHVVGDRRAAIARAIELAQPAGVVAILGRGGERLQEVRGGLVPLDDADVARQALDATANRVP